MIDYFKIAKSVNTYVQLGYIQMEAPWWVSKEILDITTPKDIPNVYHVPLNNKYLVASAEQGFLYIAAKGRLPAGRYQSVTPCFRDEPIGVLSRRCFIKNELIDTADVSKRSLEQMILDAMHFFGQYVPESDLEVVSTGYESKDILYKGIELGSYGIRSCEFLQWVYGTGCAEPRLSHAIQKVKFRKK